MKQLLLILMVLTAALTIPAEGCLAAPAASMETTGIVPGNSPGAAPAPAAKAGKTKPASRHPQRIKAKTRASRMGRWLMIFLIILGAAILLTLLAYGLLVLGFSGAGAAVLALVFGYVFATMGGLAWLAVPVFFILWLIKWAQDKDIPVRSYRNEETPAYPQSE